MNLPPDDDNQTILAPAPAFPNALMPGTKLGEFEITRVVGQGGFGIVYLARDHSLGRDVALKEYMPAAFAGRTGETQVTILSSHYLETFNVGLSSFVKEAQLLARFDHPCLVKVYRFWEANGTGYMAMPFYQAPTLKQMLKEQHDLLSTEAWLKSFLGHILDALQVLHDKQCYHRDIAPDNILMLDQEIPLLLDFGAARRVIGDMTQALTVILKPGYAPIEQYGEMGDMAQGPWTDLYALASVIYFIIVGKVPQAAMSRLAADKLVPLAESAKGRYSPEFLEAIDAALRVRPEERPQSTAAFRMMLQLETAPTTQRHRPSTVVVDGDEPPVTVRTGRPTAAGAAVATQHTSSKTGKAGATPAPATVAGAQPAPKDDAAKAPVAGDTSGAQKDPAGATARAAAIAPASPAAPAAPAAPGVPAKPARKLPLIPIAAGAAVVVVAVVAFSWPDGKPEAPPAPPPVVAAAPAAVAASPAAAVPAGPPPCQLHRADGSDACPVMVKVPAGNYRIGSQQGDRSAAPEEFGGTEKPVAAFELSAYEVTNEQWQLCVADNACPAAPDSSASASMPVTGISWDAVQGYLAWLSGKTGATYRLPTELEWEYAARAATTTIYPWGDRIGDKNAHCGQCGSLADYPRAAPVGSFKAYAGLYDMVGNVYEWVDDCWSASHAEADVTAAASPSCKKKVQKGGAYDSMGADVRPMARTAGERNKGDPRVGFRIAR
jgi:formylglycine-generating enzyme required for sulfatase activity/serine/threonine protein kinase